MLLFEEMRFWDPEGKSLFWTNEIPPKWKKIIDFNGCKVWEANFLHCIENSILLKRGSAVLLKLDAEFKGCISKNKC